MQFITAFSSNRLPCVPGLLILCLLSASCADNTNTADRIELIENYMQKSEYGTASLELANLIQADPRNLHARLLQGKISLAAGRPEAAEMQLLQAWELGADAHEVLVPLGHSVLAQGHFERAADVIGTQPTDSPGSLAWMEIAGTIAMYQQDHPRALGLFNKIIAIDPDHLGAKLGIAKTHFVSGQLSVAEIEFLELGRKNPLSISAWQALGAFRFEQQRYAEAERAFINAIDAPGSVDDAEALLLARAGLIETQWYLDKKRLSEKNTAELIDSYPWHPLPKYLSALLSFYDGEYVVANDQLQRVIDIVPNHQAAQKLMASINFAQGNLSRAQMFMDNYLKMNPDDTHMTQMLAQIHFSMGNAQQAALTLQKLINDQTSDPDLLNLAGTALIYSGEGTQGLGYLRRAVQLDPENIRLQTRLAAAFLNLGKIDDADALMSHWQPEAITQSSRQLLRLERFIRSGQLDRATEYAKKLRRENPSNVHALLALAEISHRQGDADSAINWLEFAANRNPDAIEPRIILAKLFILNGQHGEAVRMMQEATSTHPYNAEALSVLAEAALGTGDLSAAMAAASEAYRMAPLTTAPALTLIRTQLTSSDYWSARELVITVLKRDPGQISNIRALVLEENERGNHEQALDLIHHIKNYLPETSMVHETEGDLHVLNNNSEAALFAYRKALEYSPSLVLALKAALLADPSKAPLIDPLKNYLSRAGHDKARAQTILRQLSGGH